MANRTLAKVAGALLVLAGSCGRSTMEIPDAASGSGGVIHTGGNASGGSGGVVAGAGGVVAGAGGRGGVASSGGGGGTAVVRLPDGGLPPLLGDGGLSALLGDGGLLSGILDARRDSVLGQVICGPEARLGAPCSASTLVCVLPSLGGVCSCIGGTFLCPANTNAAPTLCPKGTQTGSACNSPLSTCVGGGANACVCGLGTYTCL